MISPLVPSARGSSGEPGNVGGAAGSGNGGEPPDNRAPVAVNDSFMVDGALLVDAAEAGLLQNDSDPDGDALSVDPSPIASPLHGNLTLETDGSFRYARTEPDGTQDEFSE